MWASPGGKTIARALNCEWILRAGDASRIGGRHQFLHAKASGKVEW